MLDFETPNSKSEVLKSNSWKITSSFFEKLILTMFYTTNSTQQQTSFYADNYFEYLLIVFTAFNRTRMAVMFKTQYRNLNMKNQSVGDPHASKPRHTSSYTFVYMT